MKLKSGFSVWMMLMSLAVGAGEGGMPFLGVATRPLSTEESRELNLPDGVGLRVEEVVAGSSAAAALVFGDVLHKLDDQILVHPRQLAVLVRLRKPGDTVTLRIVREGGAEPVDLTLGERPLIELARPTPAPAPASPAFPPGFGAIDPWAGQDPFEQMEQLQARMRAMMRGIDPAMPMQGGAHTSRRMEWIENGATMRLTEEDGDARLTITEEGKTLFDGPVNTPEQRAGIPQPYRDRLESRGAFEAPGSTADSGTML